MAEEIYESPRGEISQGDIVELLPFIYLEKPLLALKKEAETIFSARGEPFLQFNDRDGQQVVALCKRTKALLISPDCEIDKGHVTKWLACPVIPIVDLPSEKRDPVRRNRIYSMLHLPKYREEFQESFVDFNHVSTLNAEFFKTRKRLLSLSDIGRRALYAQVIRWFTRWELRNISCPDCGASFNPSRMLPVRSP